MAKVSFASMKLKVNSAVQTFDYNGTAIEVKQYLPISDKNDLIQITLQKAEEDGIYNDIKLEMYFHLNIIYLYTNISFTEKQREDEAKLYDQLQSNGIIDSVIKNMDEVEYNSLIDSLDQTKNDILTYRNTAGAVLQALIQDLPRNAEAAKQIVDSFDPTKYKQIVDLANATGMNNMRKSQ